MNYNPYGASALPARYASVQTGLPTTVDLTGLDRTIQGLLSLTNLDATDLMKSWMTLMEQDNRRGILAGLDKDGVPMAPVTYRPKISPGLRVTRPPKGKRNQSLRDILTRFRQGQKAIKSQGGATGFGPYASGLHGNLTTAQYQLLGGPPLAPRDQFSRVITNFKTDYDQLRPNYWATTFWWEDVVNSKGESFLKYHFEGTARLPRRDLRGIRPEGIAKALEALRNWARPAIHEHFGK